MGTRLYGNRVELIGYYHFQVGACIVNPHNKIVGIGHNALPSVCDEEEFQYWGNRDVDKCGFAKTKYAYGEYICHTFELSIP